MKPSSFGGVSRFDYDGGNCKYDLQIYTWREGVLE